MEGIDEDKFQMKCRFCGREMPFEKIGMHLRQNHQDALIEDLMLRVGEAEIRIKEMESQLKGITTGTTRLKLSPVTVNEIVKETTAALTSKIASMVKSHRR
jgi:chaperonin cofactor prefoldin